MAKKHTSTRRGALLAALGGASAAALPTTAMADQVPAYVVHQADAELIALCDRYMAGEREYERLFVLQCEAEQAGDKVRENALFEQARASVPASHELLYDVMEMTATTVAGFRAKAEVAMTRVQTDLDGDPLSLEDAVLHSICRDVLSIG